MQVKIQVGIDKTYHMHTRYCFSDSSSSIVNNDIRLIYETLLSSLHPLLRNSITVLHSILHKTLLHIIIQYIRYHRFQSIFYVFFWVSSPQYIIFWRTFRQPQHNTLKINCVTNWIRLLSFLLKSTQRNLASLILTSFFLVFFSARRIFNRSD